MNAAVDRNVAVENVVVGATPTFTTKLALVVASPLVVIL